MATSTTTNKRLTLDITESEHRQLKMLAALHGVSMKEFVLETVLPEEKRTVKTRSGETEYLLRSSANKKRLLKATRRNRKYNKKLSSLKELKNAFRI